MRIVIMPRTHELKYWNQLFAALLERYPNASVTPEKLDYNIRLVLSVEDCEMSHDERLFLNSLSRPLLGPQGSNISDEVYERGLNRLWLMDSWYGLNNSIYDNL